MEDFQQALSEQDQQSLRDFESFDLHMSIPDFLRNIALIDPNGFLQVLDESDAPRRITYAIHAKITIGAKLESMQEEMRLVFLKALRICNATTQTDFSHQRIDQDDDGLTPYQRLAKLNEDLEEFNKSGVFDVRNVVGDTADQLDFE